MEERNQSITGVVLAGGKSSRMGRDKSQIAYHDTQHELFTARLLDQFCSEVYISKAKNSRASIGEFNILQDAVTDIGPIGGIYSIFKIEKSNAILVAACDLPLISFESIQNLVAGRSKEYDVVCLQSSESQYPEPLIAIYEQSMSDLIISSVESGQLSPSFILKSCKLKKIIVHPNTVFNANTEEDVLEAMKQIKSD